MTIAPSAVTAVAGDTQTEEIAPILKKNESDIREAQAALRPDSTPAEEDHTPVLPKKES
jgi:hypothetical protein